MKSTKDFSKKDDLLIRYLIGSTTCEENLLVGDWLNDDAEHRRYFDQLKDMYYLGKVVQSPSGFDKEVSMERIKRRFYETWYQEMKVQGREPRSSYFSIRMILSVAALLMVALLTSLFVRYFLFERNGLNGVDSLVYNEVMAPLGSRTHVILPDGTKVWLNAGSKMRYAMNFLKRDREVVLMTYMEYTPGWG
jgi:transmembrane sensor